MTKQLNAISSNWHHLVALILALFTFFMSGLVSERVFEHLPHLEDEVAYLYQARIFAGGQLVVESPEPRNAFWQPFVVDSNASGMRFGKYTPGWPALLALGLFIGQAWFINAVLSALTVGLVYRLGYEIFSPDVGVIAALLTTFSPMAFLLNGTLMSHSAGLFFATLFFYTYWRMEKGQSPRLWAIAAGLTLGVLAATRPLTTLAIALPFMAWSGIRLLICFFQKDESDSSFVRFWRTLQPLLLLSISTLIIASSIPFFNYVASGDASQNLYELVWEYDRVGFGQGYGRNIHRLSKAVRHARFDLSLTAADLFGWQFEPIGDEEIDHFQNQSDYYPARAYSFFLLPLGVIVGLFAYNDRNRRLRAIWFIIWTLVAFTWVALPVYLENDFFKLGSFSEIFRISPDLDDDPTFSWFWIIASLVWLYLPLPILARWKKSPQLSYTWLMLSIVISIVIVQMLYWIGSQRYSTRYYYEALSAASLITALPIVWLAQQIGRKIVYAVFLALCIFTLYFYSTPRIMALYRYNQISPEIIEAVQAHRMDDRPILVIVAGASSGDDRVRWRAYGALMVATSPYLDSDIVVVRDFGNNREDFIAQFPDRQVIDLFAIGDNAYFADEVPDG
jgi:MFS family permease